MKTQEVRRSVKEASDAGKLEEEEEMCGWSSLAECLPRLHEALGLVSASQTFQAETTPIKSLSKSRFQPPIAPPTTRIHAIRVKFKTMEAT